MEFKEVLGRRRSIRYFQPYREIEREKVQMVLKAARIASQAELTGRDPDLLIRNFFLDTPQRRRVRLELRQEEIESANSRLWPVSGDLGRGGTAERRPQRLHS